MRLAGLMVSILLMRSLASGVTVSHSGDGNFKNKSLEKEFMKWIPSREVGKSTNHDLKW